jgi:hypothetical protein
MNRTDGRRRRHPILRRRRGLPCMQDQTTTSREQDYLLPAGNYTLVSSIIPSTRPPAAVLARTGEGLPA